MYLHQHPPSLQYYRGVVLSAEMAARQDAKAVASNEKAFSAGNSAETSGENEGSNEELVMANTDLDNQTFSIASGAPELPYDDTLDAEGEDDSLWWEKSSASMLDDIEVSGDHFASELDWHTEEVENPLLDPFQMDNPLADPFEMDHDPELPSRMARPRHAYG